MRPGLSKASWILSDGNSICGMSGALVDYLILKCHFEMHQSLMNPFSLGWRLHVPGNVSHENRCKGNKPNPNHTGNECGHFSFLSLQPFLFDYDDSSN
jgi:hypothetical protein